ncbi:DUF1382 family protein [Escherichia coli]|nr:DUF1382 family protein [Escherichia coli]
MMPVSRNLCIFLNVGLGEAAKRDVGTGDNQIPDSLAQIGVRFVPIPVETDEEFHTLAASLSQKLEMMVAKAEADERDQV